VKHKNLEKLNLAIAAAIMLAGSALPAKAQSMIDAKFRTTFDGACSSSQSAGDPDCSISNNSSSDRFPLSSAG
jgi:hypothetical protein